MKNILLLCMVILSISLSQCGNRNRNTLSGAVSDTGKAVLVFHEYEHNFGKVSEGEKVSYVFRFDNKGTASLILASALTTCGCTVPRYDRKPIPPAGSGTLEVVFDTFGKEGMQTKTISVKSNASVPVVLLKITAEVVNNK